MNQVPATPRQAVRVFRAVAVLLLGVAVGYFVYTSSTDETSRFSFKYGLDLAGGSHLVYTADLSNVEAGGEADAMASLREVIERRINVFGVSEPLVYTDKSSTLAGGEQENRLIVELPGVTDVKQAVENLGKTPLLEFKLVDQEAIAAAQALTDLQNNASGTGAGLSNMTVNGEDVGEPFIDTGLTGRYVERAQLVFGTGGSGGVQGEPIVQVSFNDEGAALFGKITTEGVGENLAIFLDGVIISQPVIREPITGGTATISGGFSAEEARQLVRDLNFGALPVPIELSSTQAIGAALGEEALIASVKAGVIGFILLSAFMILWYRLPGVVAVIALSLYVILMLALFQLIPVVLTAAGLAGFILSVGLAVDANILIAERIKEELREGKELEAAIAEGFSRAWLAIRDSNVTHIIAGIILFWFGTSLIKGFALVFSLGVFISMFSAITISRTLLLAIPVDTKKASGRFLMGSGFSK